MAGSTPASLSADAAAPVVAAPRKSRPPTTPTGEAWRRFRHHRLAVASSVILFLLIAIVTPEKMPSRHRRAVERRYLAGDAHDRGQRQVQFRALSARAVDSQRPDSQLTRRGRDVESFQAAQRKRVERPGRPAPPWAVRPAGPVGAAATVVGLLAKESALSIPALLAIGWALSGFRRFPAWMWRNRDVHAFIDWLRGHNAGRPHARQVGFYGMDLYSLYRSADAVVTYLEHVDPEQAAVARGLYACLDHVRDPQDYGADVAAGLRPSCRDAAAASTASAPRSSPGPP